MTEQQLVVMKFGGTSVASRARWETILGIAKRQAGCHACLVWDVIQAG